MRFLCLHGMGTNGKIFEIQTARLRASLGAEHDYVFVNGSVPAAPAPGVKEIAANQTDFLRFALDNDLTSALELYNDLEEYIEMEDLSFDGIMGFSEGAGIAASLLAYHEKLIASGQRSPFGFKCGIFFCAAPPANIMAMQEGTIVELQDSTAQHLITVPTAHAYDAEDMVHPGFGQKLPGLCTANVMEIYTHSLGHMVPGSQSDDGVKETVRIINRTIDRASAGG